MKRQKHGTANSIIQTTLDPGSKRKKRGFKLQREAKEWERSFLEHRQYAPDMTFNNLYKFYIDDTNHRLRETITAGKKYLIESKLLPYFGKLPINEIRATNVRKWQNELTSDRGESGEPFEIPI